MAVGRFLRSALRDEWDGLGRISSDIRPADIATMGNAIVGLFSILAAADGHLVWAALLILAGILFDGLDGAIARLGGGGGPLGGFLDTLADTITFAVAPAVLIAAGLAGPLWPRLVLASFIIVCVMLRLARFEAMRETRPRLYFSGLSAPGGALVLAAAFLAPVPVAGVLALAAAAGLLMISRIRYPKLRGALGIVAVLAIGAVLATSADGPAPWSVWAMAGLMAVYLVAGPFYVLARWGPKETS